MNHGEESISLTCDGSERHDADTSCPSRLATYIDGANNLRSPSERLLWNRKGDNRGYQQYQYATLSNDLHDSWEETSYHCNDHGEVASDNGSDQKYNIGESDSSDEDEYRAGEFVCYWRKREVGWNDPQGTKEDSRYHDHEHKSISDTSRGWFQRGNGRPELGGGRWGFGRRSQQKHAHESPLDDCTLPNTQDRKEIVLYCVPDCDSDQDDDEFDSHGYPDIGVGSLLLTSSDGCGHVRPSLNAVPHSRSPSPLRLKWRIPAVRNLNNNLNNNGTRLSNIPILRPFLIGSRRCYTDEPSSCELNEGERTINDDSFSNYEADVSSKKDHDTVVQSISEGIVGVCDDSLVLDLSSSTNRAPIGYSQQHHENDALQFLRPLARLLRGNHHQRSKKAVIKEFHTLLRKEDWSFAATVLSSNLGPSIAQTWHPVQRLYGGRYDGEVLPLHAACALRPPVSFIEQLAAIYPEALLAKEKSFGRVPLHVACRSLAHSSVIRILCEMEPTCVEERDSLKRVALHYLIKNYTALGEDLMKCKNSARENPPSVVEHSQHDDDCEVRESLEESEQHPNKDGIVALKILLKSNPKCVHASDHRGWIPLHVACSSSSRKGMTNVLKLLLETWPESVLRRTSKGSDVFDCVDLAGKFHPTRDLVLSILNEAKQKIQCNISCEETIKKDQVGAIPSFAEFQECDNIDSDKSISKFEPREQISELMIDLKGCNVEQKIDNTAASFD